MTILRLSFHYFHSHEQPMGNYFTYLPLSLFISRDQRRCAEADRDRQNIWDPRKDCRQTLHRGKLNRQGQHLYLLLLSP